MSEYCDDCDRWFKNNHAIIQHYMSSRYHDYCRKCDRHFNSMRALEQHHENSYEHNYCTPCQADFDTPAGLIQHYVESGDHHYCQHCDRHFQASSNLRSHSIIHLPKNVACPGCNRGFATPSALTLHLEAGTCTSGITRSSLNRHVRSMDRDNLITNPSRMLTYGENESGHQTLATRASWNGHAYECYFCGRAFRTLSGLNAHLKSPVHEGRGFRCPNRECGSGGFVTLSGLVQHVENGDCGVQKFKGVREVMGVVGKAARYLIN